MQQIAGSWKRHAALIVGYTIAYLLLRSVSIAHWQLHVGLNFSLVLLLPRKYWPTLLLAGALSALPIAYRCLPLVGPIPAALILFPPAIFAMLPIGWLRRRRLLPSSGVEASLSLASKIMGLLLACMALDAVLTALLNTGMLVLQYTLRPENYTPAEAPSFWIWGYLLGAAMGMLMVAPIVLTIWTSMHRVDTWSTLARRLATSHLMVEGVLLGVTSLALLTLLGRITGDGGLRQGMRMAMFLPVIWMAVRHGWQGAAIGGTVASVGIMFDMPARYDPDTMMLQAFMVAAIASLLPLGAVISRFSAKEHQLTDDLQQANEALRHALREAHHLATHDMLTGLPNRIRFHTSHPTPTSRA